MPTQKFTARGVKTLKPKRGKETFYWDQSIPGFGVRVTARGGRSWTVMYRNQSGVRRRMTRAFDLSLADAREWAKDVLRRVASRQDPAAEEQAERKAETFTELADSYLENYAKPSSGKNGTAKREGKRSWRKDARAIERDLKPKLGPRKVRDIRRADIKSILNDIVARGAPIQANRVLEIIRKIFAYGIDEIAALENMPNPCAGIKKPSKETPRHRVLTDNEIRAAWRALEQVPEWSGAAFKLRLLTGQRGVEVLTMRRQDLSAELTGNWWTIPTEIAKSKRPHRVPLSEQAVAVLLEHTGKESFDEIVEDDELPPNIFENPRTYKPYMNVAKAIASIRKAAKVDIVNHDLRRTASSRMTELGTPRFIVERVLGHTETSIAGQHYDLYGYGAEKREALEGWAGHLTRILEMKPEEGRSRVVALSGNEKDSPRD